MKLYKRLNQDALYDPYRKILIPNSPEERVRQQLAAQLTTNLHIPKEFIITELHLSHVEHKHRKRADIVVSYVAGNMIKYLLVIEVKSSNIPMNDRILIQALDYQKVLKCDYVGVANSGSIHDMLLYQVDIQGKTNLLKGVHTFSELLHKVGLKFVAPPEPIKRLSYKELSTSKYLDFVFNDLSIIGEDTPKEI